MPDVIGLPERADVVVIGAGAAGLAAALAAHDAGADVAVLEKSDRLGGTAAISGGIVWAPGNARMAESGAPDDRQEARAYFDSLDHGDIRSDMIDAFIDQAGPALAFLERVTPLRFETLPGYPDYYLDRPGARAQGRALDSGLFPFSELGVWAQRIADNGQPAPIKLSETPLGGFMGQVDPAIMAERLRVDARGWGQSLIASLLRGCLDRGIEPKLGVRATALEREEGRVVGVSTADGARIAARSVIIATGGFEHDRALVQAFLKGPMTAPASPPTNTGDGLRMAMAAGAALGNMTSAWWMPVIETGDAWFGGARRAAPVLLERTLPGSIMVNRAGVRFCNEAANYSALAGAFHAFDPAAYDYSNLPAYLIVDGAFRARFPVAGIMPGRPAPFMVERPTLAALAEAIGIDPAALQRTVARFNAFAEAGVDQDFKRGEAAYDRFYGDRSRPGAFATLGALTTPPFSAVEIKMGALGTNGGALTDAQARVLDHDGAWIRGLYAAGNCMAGPTGGVYAGAGGTLGPALTFGVIAGRHAASLANDAGQST